MSLVKPARAKGEQSASWMQRRDGYRLAVIEDQIKQIQNDVKRLQGVKK